MFGATPFQNIQMCCFGHRLLLLTKQQEALTWFYKEELITQIDMLQKYNDVSVTLSNIFIKYRFVLLVHALTPC